MWRLVLAAIWVLALLGCSGDPVEKQLKDGFIAFQQQNYDQAIENYEKAISLGARSPAAYNMLGMAYRFKNQKEQSPDLQEIEIDSFRKAVEIDPKFWVAMINLGTTYYFMGEKAKAAPWFRKALALNPNHPEKAQIEKMIAEGSKTPEAGRRDRRPAPRSRPDSE